MKTVGIVAEYNPFHNGHRLLIERLRDPAGPVRATHVVAVMSGNFTQRGEPALFPKHDRARMALCSGVDLVLELPVPWATATAERFALGAVSLLDALGCVDVLGFGSECGDLGALEKLCDLLDDPRFPALLAYHLKSGISFPEARQAALEELHGPADLLADANNTLGLEYLKALRRLHSPIEAATVKRIGAAHDAAAPRGSTASGTFLRRQITEGRLITAAPYLPDGVAAIAAEALRAGRAPATVERLERVLLASLRGMTAAEMAGLPGISEGLENRLCAAVRQAVSYEDLIERLKTRRYPRTRLQRILTAGMLKLPAAWETERPPYLRVLGATRRGDEILTAAKPGLPLVSRAPQFERLDDFARAVWATENRAADLYGLALPTPTPCGIECTDRFIREEN